ncbi:MAG: aldo/keto reductase [Bacilli bacterium]|nr:aldo/keto reductase [Bacilli bacterium]
MEYFEFSNGDKIPALGLGTFRMVDREVCKNSVKTALKLGYRHFDTAEVYENQEFIGEAIKESDVDRKELFVTTKIWVNHYKDLKGAFARDLEKLGLDYVDLLLLHQPIGAYVEAFKQMKELREEGKIKHIGVSNFYKKHIERLIKETGTIPEVDQIELHPFSQKEELSLYLKEKGILIEDWYPLASGKSGLLHNKTLMEIAKDKNRSVVQIILRWHYEIGHITFPRATSEAHLKENMEIFDFSLSSKERQQIALLEKNKGYDSPTWAKQFFSRIQKAK